MKATAMVVDPDSVEVCIAIKMALSQWKYVLRDLKYDSVPSQEVASLIREVVDKMAAHIEGGNTTNPLTTVYHK